MALIAIIQSLVLSQSRRVINYANSYHNIDIQSIILYGSINVYGHDHSRCLGSGPVGVGRRPGGVRRRYGVGWAGRAFGFTGRCIQVSVARAASWHLGLPFTVLNNLILHSRSFWPLGSLSASSLIRIYRLAAGAGAPHIWPSGTSHHLARALGGVGAGRRAAPASAAVWRAGARD